METDKIRDMLNEYLKDIFYRILDIQAKQVSKASGKRLSRTEMHSIEIIQDVEDAILTDVADKMRISKATASVSIDRLVKKGFVSKNISTKDKRKYTLNLTPVGEETYLQHKQFHDNMVNALLKDFEIADYPELLKGLKNLAGFFNSY
ncbi:MAG: MarR family transcriptional regulator [Eubacteriales bacterium]